MGSKYEIRVKNPDDLIPYYELRTNNFWEFINLLFENRKELIYFMVRF